ncbi:hypothetical protein MTKAM_23040 [Moorella thermoacetica]
MIQVDYIGYLYYQEHKSIRSIAKLLGNSRKTVRKVLRLEDLPSIRPPHARFANRLLTDCFRSLEITRF